MRLIIGGKCQGKTHYMIERYGISPEDGINDFVIDGKARCFTQYESAVRKAIQEKKDPFQLTEELLERNPSIIILCDEVGCGVVPIQREERIWREAVGRLCCLLAERAESVERVFCGIPMRLK